MSFHGVPHSQSAPATDREPIEVATRNGDVNGDGHINVADRVFLLNWLFSHGPDIVPVARVTATGQTKCYDLRGAEIPCDSATCAGQDGFYQPGCPSEGRFVDNGDGTVTDHCTGPMWQKDTADVNGDGQSDGNDFLPWCEAPAYYCENLSLAGHDDWRLPNVRELQSLVDYGRIDPSIDQVFGGLGAWYWSSTEVLGSPVPAWGVNFSFGNVS